jgi:EmrB/QacA subfamily drug resistance transporter
LEKVRYYRGMDHDTVHARRWWTLAFLNISLLVIGLDNTVLNVALPTLQRDLHASTTELQWIIDAYVLVFAGMLLTCGSMGDRFGRKGALTTGLALFGTGSLLAAFSHSWLQLAGLRAVMGLGGALIMPATLSILTNVFQGRERAKAIAIWATTGALAVGVGPALGGWLIEHFWWGSVFLINVPVVIVGLVGGVFAVPTSKDPEAPRLDPAGAALSVVGLASLLYGIIEAPVYGWLSPTIVAALALGVVVLVAFVFVEVSSSHPMLDVRFFANPRFTAASLSVTVVYFGLFGFVFVRTQYLQEVLGYNPLQAGIRVAPIAVVLALGAQVSPRLVDRIGTKLVVAAGMAIIAVGLLVAATASVRSGYGLVLVSILLTGMGMGLTISPATESIMGSIPRAKAGVGSAMNDTTRQAGGALGVAVMGSLLASRFSSHLAPAVVGRPDAPVLRTSVDAAFAAARAMGGAPGHALALSARAAFVNGMDAGVVVAAVIAAAGAVGALVFLPARARSGTGAYEPRAEPAPGHVAERAVVPA